jgi:hypothetical protein
MKRMTENAPRLFLLDLAIQALALAAARKLGFGGLLAADQSDHGGTNAENSRHDGENPGILPQEPKTAQSVLGVMNGLGEIVVSLGEIAALAGNFRGQVMATFFERKVFLVHGLASS